MYSEYELSVFVSSISKYLLIALLCSKLLLASSFCFAEQTKIGVAAIVNDATVVGRGELEPNAVIYEHDVIKTGNNGSITILFNDESMFTLGPNAHASIDVFENSGRSKTDRSIIQVTQGYFHYYPGAILAQGGSQFIAVGNKLLGKANGEDHGKPAPLNTQSGYIPPTGTGGLSLYVSNGIKGNVVGPDIQFKGKVDVFDKTDSGLKFLGSAPAAEVSGLKTGVGPGFKPDGPDINPGRGPDINPGRGPDINPGHGIPGGGIPGGGIPGGGTHGGGIPGGGIHGGGIHGGGIHGGGIPGGGIPGGGIPGGGIPGGGIPGGGIPGGGIPGGGIPGGGIPGGGIPGGGIPGGGRPDHAPPGHGGDNPGRGRGRGHR